MAVKEVKAITLGFVKPVIKKLIFTNSKEEAARLEKEGYVIYFPSELTKELQIDNTIYVLGNIETNETSDNEVQVQSRINAEYFIRAVQSSIHDTRPE